MITGDEKQQMELQPFVLMKHPSQAASPYRPKRGLWCLLLSHQQKAWLAIQYDLWGQQNTILQSVSYQKKGWLVLVFRCDNNKEF